MRSNSALPMPCTTTHELLIDDQWIHQSSAIVDHHVANQRRLRFRGRLLLANVRRRKCQGIGIEIRGRSEIWLHVALHGTPVFPASVPAISDSSIFMSGMPFTRTAPPSSPRSGRRLPIDGREGDGLGLHLLRGQLYRRTCRDRNAAGNGRDAEWEFSGIGGFNRHIFELNAERVSGNLCKCRAMALALAGCAGGDNSLAGRRHANGRPFERPEPNFSSDAIPSPRSLPPFRLVVLRFEVRRVDLVENSI